MPELKLPPIVVLDGGFSSQLSVYVGDKVDGDPLWTARFLQTNPKDVLQTHLDFLHAGANAISTNTYQASIGGFVKYLSVSVDESYALIRLAVELAQNARSIYLKECSIQPKYIPVIVGSVGPYGAHLHDGSEYNGGYADTTSSETMREWHLPRIKTLIDSGVDLLAFETIPCQKEAAMLVELLKEFPTIKAWLSFSCKDDSTLANGEKFKDVVNKCWDATDQLVAIGVNCCSPGIVANLFKGINDQRQTPIPLVTYPNSGEKYSAGAGWVERDKCEALANFVPHWLDMGVRFVGGCCRTYKEDIAQISKQVSCWCDRNNVTD